MANENKPSRGDVRADGKMFWDFSGGNERWLNPDKYSKWNEVAKSGASKWVKDNPEKSRLIKKKSALKLWEATREKRREQAYAWKKRNPERAREVHKKSRIKRHAKFMEWKKRRDKERRATDPFYKIKCNLRGRVKIELKRMMTNKTAKTSRYLGCDWVTLKAHIESLFSEGMTWENYGAYKCGGPMKWNIDHRVPTASASDVQSLERLLHYKNLQPLWATDNIIKSDKILPEFQHLLPASSV